MLQSCSVSVLQIGSTPPKRSRCSSMNATSVCVPVELGREERRRSFQDLVRALEFGVLPLERLELSRLLSRGARLDAGVDLGLADPLAQALDPDVELGSDRADRFVLGLVLISGLQDQAHCPLADLTGILLRDNGLDPSK
jgi:hypothetical protein